ncbi:tetratricopeptide repeat protein [Patescibacteria group bacterium]
MWTYLTIFASIFALLIVFTRRAVLVYRGKKILASTGDRLEDADLDKMSKEKKKKLSRDQKSQVEDLRDKAERMIKVGKEEEAIKHFIQALAVNESDEETLHKLGMLYMKKKMFSPASALFKQLITINEDALHYSHLGLSFYHLQDFEGARHAYQKAVELDEKRPQRFVSLCQVYRSLDYPHAAIIALNKAVELEKENLDLKVLLADLMLDIKELFKAETILKELFDLDPDNPGAKAVFEDLKKIRREKNKKE